MQGLREDDLVHTMEIRADTRGPDRQASSWSDVDLELTRQIFHRLVPTLVLAAAGVVGGAVVLALHFHDPMLRWFAGTMMFFWALRVAVTIAFNACSKRPLTLTWAYRWQALYGAATFVYCCTVAGSSFYNFQHYPLAGSRVHMIGIFCLCGGLSARVGLRPWIVQLCGLVPLLTLAFSVWHIHSTMTGPAAMLVCFFAYQYYATVDTQFRNAVEQLRSRHQLRRLSEQDALTGLANRRYFQSCLTSICSEAKPFGILYIDLDRFKRVNDTLGHAAGDALLIQVAERLSATLRSSDLLARLGGDEFAILQSPLDNAAAAQALAARINHAIGLPFQIAGEQVQIGASVGIRLSAHGDVDPSTVLSNADKALYEVKQAGGGSFRLAEA